MLMKKFRIKRCRKKCMFYTLLLITIVAVWFHEIVLESQSAQYRKTNRSSSIVPPSTSTHTNNGTSNREIGDDQVGIPDRAKFQQINKHDAWVYSAFYDTVNNKRLIRVFGAQAQELNETILCYMRDKETSYFTAGNRTLLHDYRKKGRRIFSYECELRKDSRPSTVSIVFNQSDTPTNTIKVFYPLPLQRNFTVCYGILYSFKQYKQLVQNVEFNRVLGAEHVFVYKLSVFKQTEAVLKYYQKQRFMTVIEWIVPVSELHYFGQDLVINDCVYRNKGVSRFVVIQDTDEFIIPNHHVNWYDLITEIDRDYYASKKKAVSKLATYIFESTFFPDKPNISEWAAIKHENSLTSEEEQFFEKNSLTVFTHVSRLNKTFGQARQKSIVRPDLVVLANIHKTFSHHSSATDIKVNVNLSLVHHQRTWINSSDCCIIDTTSWRFRQTLIPVLNQTFNELHL